MKKLVAAFGTLIISSAAFAGDITCKGGILSENLHRYSTLSASGDGSLVGYKADRDVGGFSFKAVKNSSGRMDLSILSDSNGSVVAEAKGANSLTVSVSQDLKATVFCEQQ